MKTRRTDARYEQQPQTSTENSPLTSQSVNDALPEAVMAQCRPLIAQMLDLVFQGQVGRSWRWKLPAWRATTGIVVKTWTLVALISRHLRVGTFAYPPSRATILPTARMAI